MAKRPSRRGARWATTWSAAGKRGQLDRLVGLRVEREQAGVAALVDVIEDVAARVVDGEVLDDVELELGRERRELAARASGRGAGTRRAWASCTRSRPSSAP